MLTTLLYEDMRSVLPKGAAKTVFLGIVEQESYEMTFYSLFPGQGYRQCQELAETGLVDSLFMEKAFAAMAGDIRKSDAYQKDSVNIVTLTCIGETCTMETDYVSRGTRLYPLKKEWKKSHLQ